MKGPTFGSARVGSVRTSPRETSHAAADVLSVVGVGFRTFSSGALRSEGHVEGREGLGLGGELVLVDYRLFVLKWEARGSRGSTNAARGPAIVAVALRQRRQGDL